MLSSEDNNYIVDRAYKEARSKLYENFDGLSDDSKKRIIDSGILRTGEQVFSGIDRGNEALIKKYNIKKDKPGLVDIARGRFFYANDAGKDKGVQSSLHVVDQKNNPIISNYVRNRLSKKMGRPLGQENFKNMISQVTRHEIDEIRDPNTEFLGASKLNGKVVGMHNSFGVLARESNLNRGFSYLPDMKINPTIRKRTGEADILDNITGKDFSKDTYSKKDIRGLEKTNPRNWAWGRYEHNRLPDTALFPDTPLFSKIEHFVRQVYEKSTPFWDVNKTQQNLSDWKKFYGK